MAIRVLLEHQVPEDHIIFLCLIAAPPGLHTIARAFPKVRIVTSYVDPKLNESFHIIPGIGNFGGIIHQTTIYSRSLFWYLRKSTWAFLSRMETQRGSIEHRGKPPRQSRKLRAHQKRAQWNKPSNQKRSSLTKEQIKQLLK